MWTGSLTTSDVAWAAVAFVALAVVGLVVRLWPFRANALLGVDNWYWLLAAEDVKRRRRLPATLPCFMLEKAEQWYPPLYSGLLALLPIPFLEKHGGKFSQAIDLAHSLLIFLGVFVISGRVAVALLAGLSYLLAHLPLRENVQLQPRGLANLIVTLGGLGLWWYIDAPSTAKWAGLLAVGVVLLFLHKMNTQMWAVYLLGFALWARDWTLAALLPASVVVAIVVSGGFYLKVLRHHGDVVLYWHRNIRHLGSHQYYESRRYGRAGFASTAIHRPGFGGWLRKLAVLVQCNIFVVLVPLLAYASLACVPAEGRSSAESFLWFWFGLIWLWAFLTTAVPYFRSLGAGVYYLYQSFFPLLALAGLLVSRLPAPLQAALWAVWGAALVFSALSYVRYLRQITGQNTDADHQALRAILEHLRTLPGDGVLCVPIVLSDCTAYWTRKRVFWGAHGYGFCSMLQPYFPVMEADVAQTLAEQGLSYVLFKRGYLDALTDIGLAEGTHVRRAHTVGAYELYEVLGPAATALAAAQLNGGGA